MTKFPSGLCRIKKMLYQSVYSRQNRGKIVCIRPIANCSNRKVQHLRMRLLVISHWSLEGGGTVVALMRHPDDRREEGSSYGH